VFPVHAKVNCKKHPVYCQIVKNKPGINKRYARRLSDKIYKYTKKYRINKRLFTAMLMQESRYNLKAKNCTVGLDETFKENKVCQDYGIGQISYITARYDSYKFDMERLTTDLDYSIKASLTVLKDIKDSYGRKEEFYWTRYNARSPKKRTEYQIAVERWL
jgi:soluble lytic murein transglycosylase-like protein